MRIHNQISEVIFNRKRLGSVHCFDKCSHCKNPLEFSAIEQNFVCGHCGEMNFPSKFRVYYKGHSRRFDNFQEARNYLLYLQQLDEQGKFSISEFKSQDQLGFDSLVDKWLKLIRETFKNPYTFTNYKFQMFKAIDFFKGKSVINFQEQDFQSFLNSLEVSNKTKHSYLAVLKQFFKWCLQNSYLEKLPSFPKVKFNSELRTTITKETQFKILEKILDMTKDMTPKVFFGAKLCCNYMVRWSDIRNIREKDIDLVEGKLYLHSTKTVPRILLLTSEDTKLFKELLTDKPDEFFFRWPSDEGIKGVKLNHQFHRHLIADWWRKASKELYGKPFEFYSGSKHSSISDLHENGFSPEQIQMASGHLTKEMLRRYLIPKADFVRGMYEVASGKKWQTVKKAKKKAKRVDNTRLSKKVWWAVQDLKNKRQNNFK